MKTHARHNRGFTLIELVAVIIIVGILAAFVAPRFLGRGAFEARGVRDSLVSALRYAQKTAIAGNCPVQVKIKSDGYRLMRRPSPCTNGAAFSKTVVDPAGGGAFELHGNNNVTLSPTPTIIFLATGATESGADTTITVNGTRPITIIGLTGYVKTR